MELFFREPRPADAQIVYQRLRPADRRELFAKFGKQRAPEVLDRATRDRNFAAVIASAERGAEGFFGIQEGEMEGRHVGVIWALGSPYIVKNPKWVMREARKAIAMFKERFPELANYVDARNTVHINFMKHLGFRAERTIARYGIERRPFIFMVN